jgi:hypothetical protein
VALEDCRHVCNLANGKLSWEYIYWCLIK